MNINRHNYEEFFVLYMDNELSSDQRRMVEAFVENNPDLKDELDILSQSKIVPDNSIVFENKEELMRMTNGSSINLANYEEWLTPYIDNELTSEQMKEVENFIAAYPQTEKELALLQKTKLQPEEIVFPYKESLYRRTEKVRVVQMRWFRIAVAAVLFIAFSITAVFLFSNEKPATNRLVNTTPGQNIKNADSQKAEKEKQPDNPTTTLPGNNLATVQQEEQKTKPGADKQENSSAPVVKNELPEKAFVKKEDQVIVGYVPSNNLPKPINNPNLKDVILKTGLAGNQAPEVSLINKPPVTFRDEESSSNQPTASDIEKVNPDATYASFDEGGSNKKSRGFFRKAVRFFKKTTGVDPSNDDEKVLIGALAVKLN